MNIGGPLGLANVLILGTLPSDPTGDVATSGAIYYRTSDNAFRIFKQGTGWTGISGGSSDPLVLTARTQPAISAANQAIIYLDSSTQNIMTSINGQAYFNLAGASGATVPAKVTGLAATAGVTTISLSWTAPNDGGRAITDYRIYRGGSSGSETYLTTSATISFTNSGLPNGAKYYYKVSAVNSIGEGVLSDETNETTIIYCYCDADKDSYYSSVTTSVPVSTCSDAQTVLGYACRISPAGNDCNDSCANCYPGSGKYTASPDGADQDCNGVVDNTTSWLNKECDMADARGFYEGQANWVCDSECKALGATGGSVSCSYPENVDSSVARWEMLRFTPDCQSQAAHYAGSLCKNTNRVICYCNAYQ